MEHLGEELQYVCTINEANIGLQIAGIAERYKKIMMSQMEASGDKDGNVQMGMNFQKMLEGQQAQAEENKKGVWCRESGKLYFYANSKGRPIDYEGASGGEISNQRTVSGYEGWSYIIPS